MGRFIIKVSYKQDCSFKQTKLIEVPHQKTPNNSFFGKRKKNSSNQTNLNQTTYKMGPRAGRGRRTQLFTQIDKRVPGLEMSTQTSFSKGWGNF
ncbi:hypothetical protein CDAR_60191 [Caerostris darwini]|uniref:Uncharacterized protein n=1 Tax=Caerostris darwini TaxID=1538125 RepID=A0AAV4QN09_9ARAC|nr:hypothetical protein CDAR_60191 [Caerostris darwini]